MSGAKLASILLFAAPLVAQRGDSSQDPARPRLPALALPTPDGARVELDRRNGRRLVLAYVRRGQALSRRVLADLRAELGELQQRQVDVLAVASGPADAWRKTQESLPFPLALDPEERLLEWLAPKAL
ncbi:MAG: peroxiredoxin family protein, partial [Planctomycetota bacterium]